MYAPPIKPKLHDANRNAFPWFLSVYLESLEFFDELRVEFRVFEYDFDDQLVCLYRLVKGKASESHGLQCSKKAGMSAEFLARMNNVVEGLKRGEQPVHDLGTDGVICTELASILLKSSDLEIWDAISRVESRL